ncbi:hypothetical protein X777_01094 [Ooceraea biroi]|uniref:Uncharacterized protein n=1 Tax=Ooceraea biroi TaxID=2015173 RepID=A0A026WTS1_OOCBI|nr:hypothetical protein X777_01094 [Ooceraea biroi]
MEKIKLFERKCLRICMRMFANAECDYKRAYSNKKIYEEAKIPRSDNYSVVSRHRLKDNHEFEWRDVAILHQESNVKKREIAEMFHIKRHNNAINSMRDTENLPSIYDNILTNT